MVISGSVSDSVSGEVVSVEPGEVVDSGEGTVVLSAVVCPSVSVGSANAPMPITDTIINTARNTERRRNNLMLLFFISYFQPGAVLSLRI